MHSRYYKAYTTTTRNSNTPSGNQIGLACQRKILDVAPCAILKKSTGAASNTPAMKLLRTNCQRAYNKCVQDYIKKTQPTQPTHTVVIPVHKPLLTSPKPITNVHAQAIVDNNKVRISTILGTTTPTVSHSTIPTVLHNTIPTKTASQRIGQGVGTGNGPPQSVQNSLDDIFERIRKFFEDLIAMLTGKKN